MVLLPPRRQGAGNRDIYTNNPAAYPDAVGTPDQSPNSEDVLTISRTTLNKTVMIDGIPYRLVSPAHPQQ